MTYDFKEGEEVESKFKVGDWVVISSAHPTPGKHGEVFRVTDVVRALYDGEDPYYYTGDIDRWGVWEDFLSLAPNQDTTDPEHYKFPGGAEVRHISEWLTANAAQALQYIARSSRIDGKNKGDATEDLKKAIRFLEFEIERLGVAE